MDGRKVAVGGLALLRETGAEASGGRPDAPGRGRSEALRCSTGVADGRIVGALALADEGSAESKAAMPPCKTRACRRHAHR